MCVCARMCFDSLLIFTFVTIGEKRMALGGCISMHTLRCYLLWHTDYSTDVSKEMILDIFFLYKFTVCLWKPWNLTSGKGEWYRISNKPYIHTNELHGLHMWIHRCRSTALAPFLSMSIPYSFYQKISSII